MRSLRRVQAFFITTVVLTTTSIGPSAHSWPKAAEHEISSSYWWTLTDDVTPAALRSRVMNRGLQRIRFNQAEGSSRPCELPNDLVQFYFDGSLYSEDLPFWKAFSLFSKAVEASECTSRPECAQLLPGTGLPKEAVIEILDESDIRSTRESMLESQVEDLQLELAEMINSVRDTQAYSPLRLALHEQDVITLSKAFNRRPVAIQAMLSADAIYPELVASLESIERLEQNLLPSSWGAFRDYLLTEVAPALVYVSFDDWEVAP